MSDRMKEQLAIRHQERLDRFEQRRLQRLEEKKETNESSDIFINDFNREKRELLNVLHNLDANQPRPEITAGFDKICQILANLQKFVSDSVGFLPSYDMRRAQEILQQLQHDITSHMDVLLPKKKFTFKSRQKNKGKEGNVDEQTKVSENQTMTTKFLNDFGFMDKVGEDLILTEETSSMKDINLSNLENCTVTIHGHPSAIRMKNLINSTIKCGPVSRAVFINDCYDCTCELACQQLRIHSTSNTKFFIHVTSKAIIEDSEGVGFGKYSFTYEGIENDFQNSGLDINVNNWREIDDFNWLKLDEQSPNWYLIDIDS